MRGSVVIVSFARAWDRSDFACGKTDLDVWLKEHAGQAENRHNARTFLAVDPDSGRVVGYYTTLTYRLELDDLASAFGAGRRYPMPAVLLARLAVDRTAQGSGLGGLLLLDALTRIASAAHSIGFEVVVVDAIDDDAATFYRYHGFTPFRDTPRRLFLTTKDLLRTLASAT